MSRPKRIITENEKRNICENYKNGASLRDLQKQTKLQQKQIKIILNQYNIKILTAYETKKKIALLKEKNYFDELNKLQCYVLGIIFGDGCVYYDPIKYKYAVTIVSNDVDILSSANKLFDGKFSIIKRKKSNAFNLVINSKHLVQELITKFQLQSPKSHNLVFPNLPLNMYSFFISGLLSADGCIRIDNRRKNTACSIEFSYSSNCLDFVEKLQTHLISEIGISKTKIKHNTTKRKNINYSLRYTGNNAIHILEYIYSNTDETTRCKRKFDIYQNYLTCVSNSII